MNLYFIQINQQKLYPIAYILYTIIVINIKQIFFKFITIMNIKILNLHYTNIINYKKFDQSVIFRE